VTQMPMPKKQRMDRLSQFIDAVHHLAAGAAGLTMFHARFLECRPQPPVRVRASLSGRLIAALRRSARHRHPSGWESVGNRTDAVRGI
jgi:hypothetical protein